MFVCVPDSGQSGSVICISSSFLLNIAFIKYTVTTIIWQGAGAYGTAWTHVHIEKLRNRTMKG